MASLLRALSNSTKCLARHTSARSCRAFISAPPRLHFQVRAFTTAAVDNATTSATSNDITTDGPVTASATFNVISTDGAVTASATSNSGPAPREVFITSKEALHELIHSVEKSEVVGLDTEFISFPNYRNALEVVQISTPDILAVIDYRAVKSEMRHLVEAMFEKELILHAAEMDMQILYDLAAACDMEQRVPKRPFFDTQIAASFAGMGTNLGYGPLIEKLFGVTLEKSQTLADWSRRPLTPKQIDYCVDDVRYLIKTREILLEKLNSLGRREWFDTEIAKQLDSSIYAPRVPREAWHYVRRAGKVTTPTGMTVLRELAAWRETVAASEGKSSNLIMRDDLLVALSLQQITKIEELEMIQGVKAGLVRRHGKTILKTIQTGIALTESDPAVKKEIKPRYVPPSPGALNDMLSAYVVTVAKVNGLSAENLCPKYDLRMIAAYDFETAILGPKEGEEAAAEAEMDEEAKQVRAKTREAYPLPPPEMELEVFKGWRRDMVGLDLLAIKRGEPLMWDAANQQLRFVNRGPIVPTVDLKKDT